MNDKELREKIWQASVDAVKKEKEANPDVTDDEREAWSHEIRQLEAKGIR